MSPAPIVINTSASEFLNATNNSSLLTNFLFGLLILFLERLDGEEKAQVIDYYSKNMQQLGGFYNTFPSR